MDEETTPEKAEIRPKAKLDKGAVAIAVVLIGGLVLLLVLNS